MVFNAIFNYFSALSWSQYYWWRKPEYPEKTTELLQVTDKLSHNDISSTPCHERGSNSQLPYNHDHVSVSKFYNLSIYKHVLGLYVWFFFCRIVLMVKIILIFCFRWQNYRELRYKTL